MKPLFRFSGTGCGRSSESPSFIWCVTRWLVLALCTVLGVPEVLAQLIVEDYSYSKNPHEVLDVYFVDSQYGWMTIWNHNLNKWHIFQSADGGSHWLEPHNAPAGVFLVDFLSRKAGWALQGSLESENKSVNCILRTKDSGKSWHRLCADSVREAELAGYNLISLAFADKRHGWLIGASPNGNCQIYQTSNGAKSFAPLNNLQGRPRTCYGVQAKGRNVWIYGDGSFLHSEDAGKTWNSLDLHSLNTSPDLFSISSGLLMENGRGWIVGLVSSGAILGTQDFGEHWERQLDTGLGRRPDSISSSDGVQAFASAPPNLLYSTIDGGSTWTKKEVLPSPKQNQADFFIRLVMLKTGRGWLLRGGGYVYETHDAGDTWHVLDLLEAE